MRRKQYTSERETVGLKQGKGNTYHGSIEFKRNSGKDESVGQ